MPEQKTTPGPWESLWDYPFDEQEDWLIRNKETGERVAWLVEYDNGAQLACTREDARLIAAAPELLAALEEIRDVLAWNTTADTATVNRIDGIVDAALMKALE